MAVDFNAVRKQVKELGENAMTRSQELLAKRTLAFELLEEHAQQADTLLQRVEKIVRLIDPNLRCAIPAAALASPPEPLDMRSPLPGLPAHATVLAADGSQIAPDRHAQVNFCLINVGSIQMGLGRPEPPEVTVRSELLYDEKLYTRTGVLTDGQVALMRDLNERARLLELAKQCAPPVITFTDGPMELWGAKDALETGEFEQSLDKYQEVLRGLSELGAATAGYVDKPSAGLVIRLLEIAMLAEEDLREIKKLHPLRGISDRTIFQSLLGPGERSAVFAIQSRSAHEYHAELALHFFYLNVGRTGKPWLARVEIPAWVAEEPRQLDDLHAVLFQQCQIMGNRPFPYLIHRAHEAAVVSLDEKEQIGQMIVLELQKRGVPVDETSAKQSAKDQPGRTRYER